MYAPFKHPKVQTEVFLGGALPFSSRTQRVIHSKCQVPAGLALGGLPGSNGRRAQETWLRQQVRQHYDGGGPKDERISAQLRRHVNGEGPT